jgi:hypothetical protein
MNTNGTICGLCRAMKLADATGKLLWINAFAINRAQTVAKDWLHNAASIIC